MHAFLAIMALMAASAVEGLGVGNAVVVNGCDYEVYMANTPSDDGVHTTQSMTMQPNATYSQTWTQLDNGAGWSIKLSQSATDWTDNIMQYEYTFQNDGIIWYDLSDVNGNPWNADWEITATSPSSTCSPLQQAYRYATDDAYGMQACPQDSVITVTLCSGDDDGAAGSASSSVAAETSSTAAASSYSEASSTVAASTTAMPTTAASTTAESSVTQETSTPAETTTFATSTTATTSAVTTDSAGATTTEVATAIVTDVVTSTHWHHWNSARHVASRRHVHG